LNAEKDDLEHFKRTKYMAASSYFEGYLHCLHIVQTPIILLNVHFFWMVGLKVKGNKIKESCNGPLSGCPYFLFKSRNMKCMNIECHLFLL